MIEDKNTFKSFFDWFGTNFTTKPIQYPNMELELKGVDTWVNPNLTRLWSPAQRKDPHFDRRALIDVNVFTKLTGNIYSAETVASEIQVLLHQKDIPIKDFEEGGYPQVGWIRCDEAEVQDLGRQVPPMGIEVRVLNVSVHAKVLEV